MNKHAPGIVLVCALLVSSLIGCSASPATRLYLIEPMNALAEKPAYEELTVAVGPITLPEHLQGKKIVTYDERYRVNSAEFDRWAESLDENITGALVENLSVLIPSDTVIGYPWNVAHHFDYTVQVRVITFGSDPSGEVVLRVSWALYDEADTQIKFTKARYTAPRQGDEIVALVAAMSQTIEQLSRDIANALPRSKS